MKHLQPILHKLREIIKKKALSLSSLKYTWRYRGQHSICVKQFVFVQFIYLYSQICNFHYAPPAHKHFIPSLRDSLVSEYFVFFGGLEIGDNMNNMVSAGLWTGRHTEQLRECCFIELTY